jgi:hypothetical protein
MPNGSEPAPNASLTFSQRRYRNAVAENHAEGLLHSRKGIELVCAKSAKLARS